MWRWCFIRTCRSRVFRPRRTGNASPTPAGAATRSTPGSPCVVLSQDFFAKGRKRSRVKERGGGGRGIGSRCRHGRGRWRHARGRWRHAARCGLEEVRSGDGRDALWWRCGNDALWWRRGYDALWWRCGNDALWWRRGNDALWWRCGNDASWWSCGNNASWWWRGRACTVLGVVDDTRQCFFTCRRSEHRVDRGHGVFLMFKPRKKNVKNDCIVVCVCVCVCLGPKVVTGGARVDSRQRGAARPCHA